MKPKSDFHIAGQPMESHPEYSHRHKVEIMEIEHRNALESKEKEQSNAAMFGVMADVIKDPSKLQGILELANNPAFKKK